MKTLSLILLALVVVGCEATLLCGADTELQDGRCVSVAEELECAEGTLLNALTLECEPQAVCGPGTSIDPETRECRPDVVCGVGTTLDPATGNCEADVTCGDDTLFDPATGTCEPTIVCGEGTAFDAESNTCVVVDVCGAGTAFQPLTGTCVADLLCGSTLVAHEGICRSAADILGLEADLEEPPVDDNDPAFGGTPIDIALEPVGEATIVRGIIQRPVDFSGDGEADQDRDFFRFTASAGQFLRVRVVSDGLPSPAFRVTGQDYLRTSRLGVTGAPNREIVVPRDGELLVEVAPQSAIADDNATPFGDNAFGYLLVIEEIPMPSALPFDEEAAGELFDLRDNVFTAESPADIAHFLRFSSVGLDTAPELLLFDQAGELLLEVNPSDEDDGFFARSLFYSATENAVTVIVDWSTSNGFDAPFSLSKEALGDAADLGPVVPGAPVQEPRMFLEAGAALTFALEPNAGDVVSAYFEDLQDTLRLVVSPSGKSFAADDTGLQADPVRFKVTEPGVWRMVVVQDEATPRDVNLEVFADPIDDLGPLAIASPVVVTGADLNPGRARAELAFVEFGLEDDGVVDVDFAFNFGSPDIDIFAVGPAGGLTNLRRDLFEDDFPRTVTRALAGQRLLLQLDADENDARLPPVTDWSMTFTANALPSVFETEPNQVANERPSDAADLTVFEDLGNSLPIEIGGTIADDLVDVFQFTIDPPLAADELLEVEVVNLDVISAIRMDIFDSADQQIFFNSSARQNHLFLTERYGAGPFKLALEGTGADTPQNYRLRLTRRAVDAVEVEPNDTRASATLIDTVPTTIFATSTDRADALDLDFYRIDLANPLNPGEHLLLRATNMINTADLETVVTNDALVEVLRNDHEDGWIILDPSEALTLEVFLDNVEDKLYRLDLQVITDAEVEPNDDTATANELPLTGFQVNEVVAQGKRDELDVYRVTSDLGALGPDEVFVIDWQNMVAASDLEVQILDVSGVRQRINERSGSEITFTGALPFFVQVRPTSSTQNARNDVYKLKVSRAARTGDIEPNEELATAQTIATPSEILATVSGVDVDVFEVLADGSENALVIEGGPRLRQDDIIVRVLDAAGTEIAQVEDLIVELNAPLPGGAASYFVEVSATRTTTDEMTPYDLKIDFE